MLLAALGQAKPHSSCAYQVGDVRVERHKIRPLSKLVLACFIVAEFHDLMKAVLIHFCVRVLEIAYKVFVQPTDARVEFGSVKLWILLKKHRLVFELATQSLRW